MSTESSGRAGGPLEGLRVVEFAGLGPAPFAAMMLGDAGAEVLRIGRPGEPPTATRITERGRTAVELDLKQPAGRDRALELTAGADVLLEGFRPSVMERLGLGPAECCGLNPRLVYARMSGWGRTGPLAARAGHDINYLALSGALHSNARRHGPPMPPLNLVGDYGGGGMLMAFGVMAALFERASSGRGQVVDAAMLDGVNLLMCGVWSRVAAGRWHHEPGTNDIDTGAPNYNVYETSDGRYMAVGAVEKVFWKRAVAGLGLEPAELPDVSDETAWPYLRSVLADEFRKRPQSEWVAAFGEVDACVTPVLNLREAASDPHVQARGLMPTIGGVTHPAPAPTYSRSAVVAPLARDRAASDTPSGWHRGGRPPQPPGRQTPGEPEAGSRRANAFDAAQSVGGWTTLARNLGFTESPLWTADQRLIVASVSRGRLYEVFADGRPPTTVVETGGGPNGLSEDRHGTIWIAQNGGTAMPSRSSLPATPSLQALEAPTGAVRTFLEEPFSAPSDCTIGPDDRLWLTDPRDHHVDEQAQPGRIWAVDRETGAAELIADDVYFPNGIAFGPDDRLYVAESARGRILRYSRASDGWIRDRWTAELPSCVPDGVAVDPLGCVWVAGSVSDSILRISPGGRVLDEIPVFAGTLPTSICFVGADLQTLVVTAAGGGRVLAMPVPRLAGRAAA